MSNLLPSHFFDCSVYVSVEDPRWSASIGYCGYLKFNKIPSKSMKVTYSNMLFLLTFSLFTLSNAQITSSQQDLLDILEFFINLDFKNATVNECDYNRRDELYRVSQQACHQHANKISLKLFNNLHEAIRRDDLLCGQMYLSSFASP